MNVELGKINLRKMIFVSDPTYSINIWCTHTIINMLPGEYNATLNKIDMGELGKRVASLTIIHKDYVSKNLDFNMIKDVHIGVDSGCAGFWDYNKYKEISSNIDERDAFVDVAYAATETDKYGGTVRDFGTVSKSGFGDGGYTLKVAYDEENKNIVAATIDYIIEE